MIVALMVDVAFAVQGGPVERDCAAGLHTQLRAALPWLEEEVCAGIHPLRGVTPAGEDLLIGPRTRLILRVPIDRVPDCAALQGRVLALREPLQIGRGLVRSLLPYRTLYSPLVVTGDASEDRFLATVQRVLSAWEMVCQVIVGQSGTRRVDTGVQTGFSLMLHGVTPQSSLHAQQSGVGGYRKFGCGLFVPHRSADAVGV
jgi:CRISPR-associated protein Cas6